MQRIQKRTLENKKTHIIIAAPKSSSANRVIPIPNTLLKILNQYPMEKNGYFLSGSLSEVVEPRRIQYRFHKILKECGMDRTNFHVLRHTFATRCVEAIPPSTNFHAGGIWKHFGNTVRIPLPPLWNT